MNNDTLIEKVNKLATPIAKELSYDLYHVEYVKENGDNFLRIYIDKPEGIGITDCEAMSRRVSDELDIQDFISDSYYLEVSSPGLNRGLYKEEHYNKSIGQKVLVKLNKALNGKKTYKGILTKVTETSIFVEENTLVEINKENIKAANIEGEI